MLLFKKKFIEPILLGAKTQTIRLWRRCRVQVGKRTYIPGAGYIMIDSVDTIRLDELTDTDALLDGFPNATALQAEIQALYEEELQQGFQAYRVRFTRLPEKEQQRIKAERQKQKERLVEKTRAQQYEKTMKKLRKLAKT